MLAPCISLQRVYHATPPFTHPSFLVDRLWPRGISRERLTGVQWLKEVAPSTALRQRFHAEPSAWLAFVAGYRTELSQQQHWQVIIDAVAQGHQVTLLYASKAPEQHHARVLRDFLLERLAEATG